MEKLPPEVALEIFCRLPSESIVRCKLVCKSWLSLLFPRGDHNYFANMHLRRRHLQRHLEYPTMNFIAFYECKDQEEDGIGEFHMTEYDGKKLISYKVKKINFPQMFIGTSWNIGDKDEDGNPEVLMTEYDGKKWISFTAKRIYFPQMRNGGRNIRTRLAGSCNGLVCLSRVYETSAKRNKDRIGIYNLLLNEYVLLPVSELQFKYCLMTEMVIGFGHNPLTDEYKVVRVYYSHSCYIGDVEVYTLGKSYGGMWRSIGTIKYKLQGCEQPVLVNGLLHWLSQEQLNNKNREVVGEHQQIVSFDFETEEFHVTPLPYYPPQQDDFSMEMKVGLKALGGCLCLITEEVNGMDVWMLKDYMNKESWVKEFSIYLVGKPYFFSLCAICKKKDGDGDEILLWRSGKRLVTYDPKTLDFEEVEGKQVYVTQLTLNQDPVLHINSLVSLKAAGEDISDAEKNRENRSIIRAKKRKKVMESPLEKTQNRMEKLKAKSSK